MKVRLVGAELFHSFGRTDRQSSRSSQFCECPEWRMFNYQRCSYFTKNCPISQLDLGFFWTKLNHCQNARKTRNISDLQVHEDEL